MLGSLLRRSEVRSDAQISWQDYFRLWETFGFNGIEYTLPSGYGTSIAAFEGMRNPIVQAAIALRALCLGQIRFGYRPKAGGRQARKLIYTPDLDILYNPWPGASPGELPARMEMDESTAGNSYWVRTGNLVTWLDPLRVKILTGDLRGVNTPEGGVVGRTLLGYEVVDSKGQFGDHFEPGEIVHYRPVPDITHPFRGLSWLSSLLPDLISDRDMSEFRHSFLNNSATPNLIVQMKTNISEDAFKQLKSRLESQHTGPSQAFKTLYLGAGADVKVVGSDWASLQLAENQAYGETRLAAASGVPASILGINEGLKGTSLNTANFATLRRRFVDITIRPRWALMCKALEVLAPPPDKSLELWYDDGDVPFLRDDIKDEAAIRVSNATAISTLITAGFAPESVIEAVETDDLSRLEHSGMMSVQLQTPGAAPVPAQAPSVSGDAEGDDNATDGT